MEPAGTSVRRSRRRCAFLANATEANPSAEARPNTPMIPQVSAQLWLGNNRFPQAAAMMQILSQPIWLLIDDRCEESVCSIFDMRNPPMTQTYVGGEFCQKCVEEHWHLFSGIHVHLARSRQRSIRLDRLRGPHGRAVSRPLAPAQSKKAQERARG